MSVEEEWLALAEAIDVAKAEREEAKEPEPPTDTELLNAIALACLREGIMPPPEQPNTLGQVMTLMMRTSRAEADADRFRGQFNEARRACYRMSGTVGQ